MVLVACAVGSGASGLMGPRAIEPRTRGKLPHRIGMPTEHGGTARGVTSTRTGRVVDRIHGAQEPKVQPQEAFPPFVQGGLEAQFVA